MTTTKLKNTYSTSTRTFETIQKILVAHDAKQVTFDYEQGRIYALSFALSIQGNLYSFRLPAKVANVEKLLYGKQANLSSAQKEQAYRTAWANIRDWIDAQCSLIDTTQVKAEEIFLPYMLSREGRTFYEEMVQSQFLLLPSQEKEERR